MSTRKQRARATPRQNLRRGGAGQHQPKGAVATARFLTREAAGDYLLTAYAAERTTHTTEPIDEFTGKMKVSSGELTRSTLDG
jgi:hypothetical protein